MKVIPAGLASFILASVMAIPASGTTLVNGSFENGTNPPAQGTFRTLDVGSTDITGWTVLQSNVDWGNDNFASDGMFALDLNGNQGPGGMQQILATVTGRSYAVLFDMNANNDGTSAVSLQVSAGGPARSYIYDQAGMTNHPWLTMEFDFVATGASTDLDFISTTANQYFGPGLDNVRLGDVTVPEPRMTVTFLVLGLGLAAMRRRSRSSLD